MTPLAPRLLLAASALIYGFGGAMHALAFAGSAQAKLDSSGLPPFFRSELKVLWLGDSTTLIGLAAICAFLAIRPSAAGRGAILLLALIPAGTTALLYLFLGGFYAAHLLLAATAAVVLAGVMTPARRP